ncbi:hypothetical protein H0H92_011760, partial [Tricholoma furcatifolium]
DQPFPVFYRSLQASTNRRWNTVPPSVAAHDLPPAPSPPVGAVSATQAIGNTLPPVVAAPAAPPAGPPAPTLVRVISSAPVDEDPALNPERRGHRLFRRILQFFVRPSFIERNEIHSDMQYTSRAS